MSEANISFRWPAPTCRAVCRRFIDVKHADIGRRPHVEYALPRKVNGVLQPFARYCFMNG